MSKLIKVNELKELKENRAIEISDSFNSVALKISDYNDRYNEILELSKKGITKELVEKARRLRLDIRPIRIETGRIKDEQKKYIKLEDKAIMSVHNFIVSNVEIRELKLMDIEKHFERLEKERLEKLHLDRAEKLSQYVEDAHDRDLTKFEEDEFESLLLMKKKAYEDRLEAERLAKEERERKEKEEAEERERIKKENEKLKKEVKKREKREERQRKEREAYEAKLRAEREEREKVEREEKLKREKLEAELKAKEDEERKAKEAEEAIKQAELNKGDAEKVHDLVYELEAIKSKYTFKSDNNKKMFSDVIKLIDKVINHIN